MIQSEQSLLILVEYDNIGFLRDCKTKKFIQCECGKIMCYDGESSQIKCKFCGMTGTVTSGPWSAVSGGGY